MSDLICVFDVGTTGARTIVFDVYGKEIARSYKEYPTKELPVGVSEQDPEVWWNGVKETCNEVVKKVNLDNIVAISAGILRVNCTIIDKDLKPLYPMIIAMDERGVDFDQEDGLRLAIPKLLWIKKERPDLFDKVYKIIFPDTYIYMKLCDNDLLITEPTNGIYGIMDIKTNKWDSNFADKYDLPLDLWPDIHIPGEIIGDLSESAAKELGLKKNIPIILGGGDQQCSALGMGVINKGQAKITLGTYTFANLVTGDEPAVPPGGDIPIFSFPHVIKGKYMLEGAMPGTGIALKWFKDNFSQLQVKRSEENNLNVYDLLSKEASEVKPGSGGLLFIPLQMFRKGTIYGMGWNHTRAHMIRSIMEASALSAQMYLGLIEAVNRSKSTEVRADGGGINSDVWAQILADVTDRKIITPQVKDCSALGAAILGLWGNKTYNSIESAIENMVKFEKEFNPNLENAKVYKKLNRLFMPTVLDLYNKNRITKNL